MFGSTIRKDNGYDVSSYTYYPVVVIGAGESGIAMGCRLKEVLGFDQFRIFDRQSGIGGTWWINRYPGVACDVPAVFYSFSFAQNPNWTTFHPSGAEIVQYLEGVCEKYKIVDKIQLNTDITECRWNEVEGIWDITVRYMNAGLGDLSARDRQQKEMEQGRGAVYLREEKIKAKVVISSVGGLVEPKIWPANIPGEKNFEGEIFHSARWKYDVDMKDKDVIVIGTGCSAAQFVPRLTKDYGAKSVTQIMRSPPWVSPGPDPPGGEEWWNEWGPWLSRHVPGLQQVLRTVMFARSEYDWRLFGSGEFSKKERAKTEEMLIAYMKKTVPQKYWEMLTPDYGVCCKRRVIDGPWFTSLNDPKIELTTLPLSSIGEKSVTLGPRRTHPNPDDTTSKTPNDSVTLPADVVVLANGYEMAQWSHPLEIIGRENKSLQDVFEERGGPQMYMGAAMDGFPNLFAIFGPNTTTGHSSVILASENIVELTLKLIKPILSGEVAEVEVKKEAEIEWSKDIQSANKRTVFHGGGCNNWYKTDTDWNSVTYPYSQIWFTLYCMFPTYRDWNFKYTPQGLWKQRKVAIMRYLAFTLLLAGGYQARKQGLGIGGLVNLARGSVRAGMLLGAGVLHKAAGKV